MQTQTQEATVISIVTLTEAESRDHRPRDKDFAVMRTDTGQTVFGTAEVGTLQVDRVVSVTYRCLPDEVAIIAD